MKIVKQLNLLVFVFIFSSASMFAQEKQDEKILKSVTVLKDFAGMKENIPARLMQKAEGIVIIPNLINAGLGIGGKRGKGLAMVKNTDGTWSDPLFITLTAGSIGFQAGVQSVDMVLIFTKSNTLKKIGDGEFSLGGDIAVAAGPVGRSSSANTNQNFDAEVYSYSRSKGLFAGLSLSGSKLSVDKEANATFYVSADNSPAAVFAKSNSNNQNVLVLKSTMTTFNQ